MDINMIQQLKQYQALLQKVESIDTASAMCIKGEMIMSSDTTNHKVVIVTYYTCLSCLALFATRTYDKMAECPQCGDYKNLIATGENMILSPQNEKDEQS
jgi:DNA-directed RNA polymerase subunit RPC12/RpoP